MGGLMNIHTVDIVKAVIQVGFLTWAFYQFYMALDRTKIQRMLKMIFYALAFYAISFVFELNILLKVFNFIAIPYVVFLCIIFQAELRRSFLTEGLGKSRLKLTSINNYSDQIDIALNACSVLQSKRRGALLVFSRRDSLNSVISSGTIINADLSSQLILTVFDHDTPLHDGALVIQDGRIRAAGCYLPLSEQTDIKKTFGTRHRAALGISEETDSIVIVVSEETGAITLAYNARLFYDLEVNNIKRVLLAWFSDKDISEEEREEKEDENKLSLFLLDNWKPKLISLFLALCVFFFYMFSTNSTRIVSIPLDVILPIEYEAESLVPTSVDLEINGNNNIIYLIDPTLVNATVDFSSVNKEGISNNPIKLQYDETVFSKGNISLSTNPATVKVSFKEGL